MLTRVCDGRRLDMDCLPKIPLTSLALKTRLDSGQSATRVFMADYTDANEQRMVVAVKEMPPNISLIVRELRLLMYVAK